MNIIVCIKQVPEVSEIRFDHRTKTIVREGVPNGVNAFDRRALAEAIRLRDIGGGEVVVITMGPPQAREALVECLGAGADRAIHLVDPVFAGADTLATARTLASAIRRAQYDIIFCGKYSVDAETGQVGPELAELLDLPQVTGVTSVTPGEYQKTIVVERETDSGFETLECDLPVLFTAAERLIRPIKIKEAHLEVGRVKPIVDMTASDLGLDSNEVGTAGSPTWVAEIRSLERSRTVQMIDGADAMEKASRLIELLSNRGAFANRTESSERRVDVSAVDAIEGREVWAVAEVMRGELRPVSFELLGKGLELSAKLNARLSAFVAGENARVHAETLGCYGAKRVYLSEDERYRQYDTSEYAAFLVDAITNYKPHIVLFPSTSNGRDLAPRIAARLGLGLTADCINLDLDEHGNLIQHKPAFGGNIVALIYSRTFPQMATVKPGMLAAARPDSSRRAEFVYPDMPEASDHRVRRIGVRDEVSRDVAELDEARRVICVGTGIGGPESLPMIQELAAVLDAQIGATRRVVDQGWLPRQQQIGLTGKVLSPDLYIAVGVRGALNHTIGIQQSGTIVAINTDPNAEIFHTADFGIVHDWAEVVPALTEILRARHAD